MDGRSVGRSEGGIDRRTQRWIYITKIRYIYTVYIHSIVYIDKSYVVVYVNIYRTDGQKKQYIEVGSPPKKAKEATHVYYNVTASLI